LNKCNKKINVSEPFKNLFTQGMVCHETYKDIKGNWLYPDEVEKVDSNKTLKKDDGTKVVIGPSESMSKSKKNTIDPETMINQYGADAVRWFILSDSPPEKDVQWSANGVAAANKFLQKIWDLNYQISSRNEKNLNKEKDRKFILGINNFVNKIDTSINNFRFNVTIAHFYEIYKYFRGSLDENISNNTLKNSIVKIMKLMIPFTPHLAYECLEIIGCKTTSEWPQIEKNTLEEIKLAIQINGKTRDIMTLKKDLNDKEIKEIIMKKSKAKKYIENKKITKVIFVKNKIINYIIQD